MVLVFQKDLKVISNFKLVIFLGFFMRTETENKIIKINKSMKLLRRHL